MTNCYSVNYVNDAGAAQSVTFNTLDEAMDFYNSIELKFIGQSKALWWFAADWFDDILLLRSARMEVPCVLPKEKI